MEIENLALHNLREAPWNANSMTEAMLLKLKRSIFQFGLVQPLVVRPLGDGAYEVLSGNQRLKALQDMKITSAPCRVVELDDYQARILAQALNGIQGQDDIGKKAELIKTILEHIPEQDILAILPETAESLKSFAELGQSDIAFCLQDWQKHREARLKHLTFRITENQLSVIEQALNLAKQEVTESSNDNPNQKGNRLYIICKYFIEGSDNCGK